LDPSYNESPRIKRRRRSVRRLWIDGEFTDEPGAEEEEIPEAK